MLYSSRCINSVWVRSAKGFTRDLLAAVLIDEGAVHMIRALCGRRRACPCGGLGVVLFM